MEDMTSLESALCKNYGKKYGVFTGNGTTAMYLAFKALNMQNKKVIFPAISCTNPVNSAIFAGYNVEFCDINMDNYTIDVNKLREMIDMDLYGIVVPTHIYGHQCAMDKISNMCKKKNVIIIEDAAQTYKVSDSLISIVSFGHTKIFETELGGGIAFTDDELVYKKMKTIKQSINERPQNADELFDEYREKYYDIVKNSNDECEKHNKLKGLQLDSKDTFIYDLSENGEILEKLKIKDEIINDRIAKKNLYDRYLDRSYVNIPNEEENVLWRYTFIYKGNREKLLEDARKEGIDISSWYPALSNIYNNSKLENADIIQNRVINLWITNDHSEERIKYEIEILNRLMEENMYE